MRDFQKEYESKLVSAQEAVKVVKSGDWIDYCFNVAMPEACDRALAERAHELDDVKLRGLLSLHTPYVMEANQAAGKSAFTFNSYYYSALDRRLSKMGAYFHIPLRFMELPLFYRQEIESVDVAFITVCPMDRFGFFNFGPSCGATAEICRKAKTVVLEVNRNMPRALGKYDEAIHISAVDRIVESDRALPTLGTKEPTEIDRKVAAEIMTEISDGACLQLGVGSMPNAVGLMLAESGLTDLGVHSEMYVDSLMELALAGKINGTRKTTDPGKQVYTFAAGSAELYSFIDNNPELMIAPVDYVNDPYVIAQNDQFISINNAIEIDLFGQVNAESMAGRQISGPGGQLDFVIGASHSRNGKSFICLSSTYCDKSGRIYSRIVPALLPGSIVTDPRTTVHYVVTEYGKAKLKGLSSWERAEALISISHPDFREELVREAEKLRIWRKR